MAIYAEFDVPPDSGRDLAGVQLGRAPVGSAGGLPAGRGGRGRPLTRRRHRTIVFLINGLGMGNSTRCAAIMDHLLAQGCDIHVKTSGNGLTYFRNKPGLASVSETASFSYGNNGDRISGWQTWKQGRALVRAYRQKARDVEAWLAALRPDVAVIDSEYAVLELRRNHIPILAINTSETVVSNYLACKAPPRSIRSHFWCIEFADYHFHRTLCDGVLSPSPQREPTRHRKFQRIGLIVRPAVQALADEFQARPLPAPRDVRRALFMLSGSIHASHVDLTGRLWPFHIDVVGRAGTSDSQVTYHGKLMDNLEQLRQADMLVINGGHSAVSEAIALNKPTFVIPVPGHAEQFVNARVAAEMGLGIVTDESRIVDQLLTCWVSNAWIGLQPARKPVHYNGAQEAAERILEVRAP